MKNAMQLKAQIKNLAKENNVSAQITMQNYMLERLLERISVSKYQPYFILKGGFLIAAMVGLDTRATMDMDATVKGLSLTENTVREMFKEISQIRLDDEITFSLTNIIEIREDDPYTGYRITLTANYPPMAIPLKIDITTGDIITPKEILYSFKLMFEERKINVLAYNLETVLAEKIETVISRGDQNTRLRDFYDIYILLQLQRQNISIGKLTKAVLATAARRNTDIPGNYADIVQVISDSSTMKSRWENYQKSFEYAKDISFHEICSTLNKILETIFQA